MKDFWLPPGLGRAAPAPVYDCRFCDGAHDQEGLGRCARDHREDIEAMRLENRVPLMADENNDVELERYMRKVGQRMIREGRLEMKPNERARDN